MMETKEIFQSLEYLAHKVDMLRHDFGGKEAGRALDKAVYLINVYRYGLELKRDMKKEVEDRGVDLFYSKRINEEIAKLK